MAKELLLFDDYPCSTGVVDYVSRHETQVKRSKCNYRKRIDNALQRVCKFDLMQANAAMPTLRPYEIESAPKALVPYNVWRSGSAKGDCVHFFVSDYMFIGLLNASDDELRELAEARFVISPDFSQYADMTPGQRRHNPGAASAQLSAQPLGGGADAKPRREHHRQRHLVNARQLRVLLRRHPHRLRNSHKQHGSEQA